MTPVHYPYSDVYLLEHIQRISRGIVVTVSAILIWLVLASGVALIINAFN